MEVGQSFAKASITAFLADSDSKTVAAALTLIFCISSCKASISVIIEEEVVDVVDESDVGVEVEVEDEIGAGVEVVDEVEVGVEVVGVEVVDDGGCAEGLVGQVFEGSRHLDATPPCSKQNWVPG